MNSRLPQLRKAFVDIGKELEISQPSDWYKISHSSFIQANAQRSLKVKSFAEGLIEIYPDHDWQIWQFQYCPDNLWNRDDDRRKYLQWLFEHLKMKDMEDWYHIRKSDLISSNGIGMLKYYKGSISKMLKDNFKDHKWMIWRFSSVNAGFWREKENQLDYLQWFSDQRNMKRKEDWYNITTRDLLVNGGDGILVQYNNSISSMLTEVFPDHKWQIWRFQQVPKGFYDNLDNKRDYFDWLEDELEIKELSDWYRISLDQIAKIGPTTLFKKYDGIANVVRKIYPDYNWDWTTKVFRASQWRLKRLVERLFPNHPVKEEYTDRELVYPSGGKMLLDLYISEIKLAFEYQGQQHYYEVHKFGKQESQAWKDEMKRRICSSRSITLIEIPYWWDFKIFSLAGTIKSLRPELDLGDVIIGEPIPSHAP